MAPSGVRPGQTGTDRDNDRDRGACPGQEAMTGTNGSPPLGGSRVCPGLADGTIAGERRTVETLESCPGQPAHRAPGLKPYRPPHQSERIDFAGVALRADLRTIVEADLGPPDKGRKWRCPFHDDHNPSLGITPDGHRFKCWSGRCGAGGTALDWLMRRDNLSVVEAARRLDPGIAEVPCSRSKGRLKAAPPPKLVTTPRPTIVRRPATWEDPAWQAEADGLVCRAEAMLWSRAGGPALEWLRGRGLTDSTIRRFRLGFLADWTEGRPVAALDEGKGPRPIRAPRGVTIPWAHPRGWYDTDVDPDARWVGCNVRRLSANVSARLESGPKCQAIAGSSRGHGYPFGEVLPSQAGAPMLICEGELDALLAWQLVGHLANVLTIGGAQQTPTAEARAALDACPWWLIATDHDAAGDRAAEGFARLAPLKVRRLSLPSGTDIGDYHQGGGDVRSWLLGELARLDLLAGGPRPGSSGRSPASSRNDARVRDGE